MTKKIKNAPGWLGLSEDRTSFVYLEDRAEIVRRIFQLSIHGHGGYAIAKLLNATDVPAFGTSKKWDQSTIHNMLSSRATMGEYQRKQTIDGRQYPLGDPVPGYYPAVIDLPTFEAAQKARQVNLASRRGRKGKVITNLFEGVASCYYCTQPIKLYRSGNDNGLICSGALEGHGCHRFGWSYADFETTFFQCLESDRLFAQFSDCSAKLKIGIDRQSESDVLRARTEIVDFLRASATSLTLAAAGANPPSTKSGNVIRRDRPQRFFAIELSDGFSLVGVPHKKAVEVGRQIALDDLASALGLSWRQSELTALLVKGLSLTETVNKLGMSLETGRWHLREVFKRTNTHSQEELVELAERTCPVFDGSLSG